MKNILYKISFDYDETNVSVVTPYVLFKDDNLCFVDIEDTYFYQIPMVDIDNLKIKVIQKGEFFMFDIACQLLVQLVEMLPAFIGIYIIFDFLGSFFFGKS